ncbi:MAG: hypothetical protein QM723_03400 [Myxococcaceae bacterium]
MTASRYALSLSLLALLTGCPSDKPKMDGGTDSGMTGCFADSDCPDPQLFFCNSANSTCEPSCHNKGDCSDATRGQYKLDYCGGTLGCQCDEGRCVAGLCGSDSDCGSSVCRDGKCVMPPAASTVASCAVIPDYVAMKKGDKAVFHVTTKDSSGAAVVLSDGVTWAAATGTVTLETGMTVSQATFTGATVTATADKAVKASVNGHDCFASVLVVDNTVAAATVSVLVTDELSGRPVTGASIVLSDATTGIAVGAPVMTDPKGYANVAIVGALTSVNVTAFSEDFSYLTIANYPVTGSRFLSMPLRRNPVDYYGGYKGTFNNVPMTPNVHAGIAAMSLPGSITDLNISQLLGPSQMTHIQIGTAVNTDANVPAGVFLGFTDQMIKNNVSGQGLAGTCVDSSGNPDEAKITTGTCGTRAAWGLVGDVPLGDLPISAFTGGLSNINYGDLLSHIIPIFKDFSSSMVRDVQFNMTAVADPANPDFSNTTGFTSQDLDFQQTKLGFSFVAQVPDLPQFRGTYVDGVVVLGGTNVVGRGVVPLGIGVAVNTAPADNKTDVQSSLSGPGLMSMRMAPNHAGSENSTYGMVALAVSLKGLSDASVGLAASGLFPRIPQNKLVFDPDGSMGGKVDLGANGAFPAFPDTARYNFTAAAQGALPARTFKFASAPNLQDMSTVRVVFTDAKQHRWSIITDAASPTFTLPTPPGTFEDRTFSNGMNVRSTMLVQTMRLSSDPSNTTAAKLTFANLVEQNDTNADRLNDFTTGFSILDYGAPDISWKTPNADGSVMHGANVTVSVSHFKVGAMPSDDGFVRLHFGGGTGCTDVDVMTDASMGKGDITLTVPAGCTSSTAIPVDAILVSGTTNAPLDPPVQATLHLTIQ